MAIVCRITRCMARWCMAMSLPGSSQMSVATSKFRRDIPVCAIVLVS